MQAMIIISHDRGQCFDHSISPIRNAKTNAGNKQIDTFAASEWPVLLNGLPPPPDSNVLVGATLVVSVD